MTRYRNESEWNRAWSEWLERAGARVFAVVGSTYQEAGWPDRYVAHRVFAGWVEGKQDARQLTTAQRLTCKELCVRLVPAVELKYLSETDSIIVKDPWGETLAEVRHDRVAMSVDPKPGRMLLEILAGAADRIMENGKKS